jgi:hypothetical protein
VSLERASWSESPVIVQESGLFSRRRRFSSFRSRMRGCYDTSDPSNPRSIPCPKEGLNQFLIRFGIMAVLSVFGVSRRRGLPLITIRDSVPATALPPKRPLLKPASGPGGKIGDLIRSYARSNPIWNYDEILQRAQESAQLWFAGKEFEPSQRIQSLRRIATSELLSREHQIPRVRAVPQGAPTLIYARDQSSRSPPTGTVCAKIALAEGKGLPSLYFAELWFTIQGGSFRLSEVSIKPA